MAKKIGIIAIKGGVGKTTTVSNLSAAFSQEFGKRVLGIDANFSAPNLGLHFGITRPDKTLHDVFRKRANVQEAIIPITKNLHILPSSLLSKKINPFKLKEVINKIEHNYDYILIDSSPSLNEEILATMLASDELLVVTSPDYPTLSTTLRAVRLARQKKAPISGLILNKVRGKSFELTIEEIESAAETPVLAVLPDDLRIIEALSLVKPAAMDFHMSNAVIEYKKLAAAMIGTSYADPRPIAMIRKLLSMQLSREEVNRQVYTNKQV